MALGRGAVGTRAIGVSAATAPPTRHSLKNSGAIGTYAIGAYSIGGGSATSSQNASGIQHLIHWRRRGRR